MFSFFRADFGAEKGSATIEAAIVTPVIIVCITAVIYMGMILSGHSTMQAATDLASGSGSSGWKHAGADAGTGKIGVEDLGNDGLYWRIADANSRLKAEKTAEKASGYGTNRFVANSDGMPAEAEVSDFILYKKISVGLVRKYPIPAPGLFSVFGIDSRLKIHTASTAVVNDPSELIRNTDFVMDLEKKLEEKFPAAGDIGEKARNAIRQLKEKIADF